MEISGRYEGDCGIEEGDRLTLTLTLALALTLTLTLALALTLTLILTLIGVCAVHPPGHHDTLFTKASNDEQRD